MIMRLSLCVKLVLEKCYSCNYVSVEKGIERSNLANGLGFISIMEPLVCCRKNQSYSVAFKLNVLKAIAKDSLSLEIQAKV
jgi:hypothetical protein